MIVAVHALLVRRKIQKAKLYKKEVYVSNINVLLEEEFDDITSKEAAERKYITPYLIWTNYDNVEEKIDTLIQTGKVRKQGNEMDSRKDKK